MLVYLSNIFIDAGFSRYFADIIGASIVFLLILIAAFFAHVITKKFFVKAINNRINQKQLILGRLLVQHNVFMKCSRLVPLVVIYFLTLIFKSDELGANVWIYINKALLIAIVIVATLILSSFLNVINDLYNIKVSTARNRPIKSYLQVTKLLCWTVTIILVVSTIQDASPVTLLTSLGALSAVLMLTFRDSILGFVSSIQLSAYDIVRIGDWITIKNSNIDGDVIDISLNTVKIRNFDKTIATIPTQDLMTKGVINWRGMQDSGGRRIKRSLYIDMNCIKFCSHSLLTKLKKISLLSSYIEKESLKTLEPDQMEVYEHLDEPLATNIGLYREYVKSYLKHRADIYEAGCGFSFLVRQLQPTSDGGMPLEIYVFTRTTHWVSYEAIQSEIMEHLISILPLFELKVFQISTYLEFKNPA